MDDTIVAVTTTDVPVDRPPLLAQGLAAAALTAALAGLAEWGRLPLVLGVGALQLALVLAFLALVDAPAAMGVFVLGTAAALAADITVHLQHGQVGGLAGVTAVAFVGGLLQQLLRKNRSRVTESLADALVAVVLVGAAACLPAALQHATGRDAVRVGLVATGAALVVGRLTDLVLRRFALAPGASRGWSGLLLALGVGVAAGVPVRGDLTTRHAMLLGLACAATAVTADLFTDLAGAEVLSRDRRDERPLVSLRPVMLLLPFAVTSPVLLIGVRLLEQT